MGRRRSRVDRRRGPVGGGSVGGGSTGGSGGGGTWGRLSPALQDEGLRHRSRRRGSASSPGTAAAIDAPRRGFTVTPEGVAASPCPSARRRPSSTGCRRGAGASPALGGPLTFHRERPRPRRRRRRRAVGRPATSRTPTYAARARTPSTSHECRGPDGAAADGEEGAGDGRCATAPRSGREAARRRRRRRAGGGEASAVLTGLGRSGRRVLSRVGAPGPRRGGARGRVHPTGVGAPDLHTPSGDLAIRPSPARPRISSATPTAGRRSRRAEAGTATRARRARCGRRRRTPSEHRGSGERFLLPARESS